MTNKPTDQGKAKYPMPKGLARLETGAIQFGDDWPGIFIRGDNAAYYAQAIKTILWDKKTDPIAIGVLSELGELLETSQINDQ